MARKYRVALVGCGDIAEHGHVPALLKHPRFELTALCDTRPERSALLSKLAGGVATVSDYRSLLSKDRVDAVILALHPEISVNAAIDFLRAGIPVLDEKPLARSMADGERLAREIAETRGMYQIGFVFRYAPMIQALARYAKEIGTPAFYHVNVFDERLDPENKEHVVRIQQILRSSSAITHEGSHPIDYMTQFNNSTYRKISASALRTRPEFNGPNIWAARFEMADGSVSTLNIGWLLPELPDSNIAITGPNGALTINTRSGIGEFLRNGTRVKLELPPLIQNWAGQLDVFASAMDCGEATIATVHDGLRALSATTACESSYFSS
jgi:UDP-N-acetylglucosamine 3-dehydrogenase